MSKPLKKASIRCGNKYLKGFEPNEEYTIVVETFQSIIDTLAYAKNKINNGKENKND